MIDIYDEVGYIKDVIRDGLSAKWERDATLLVRYYKIEGMKKGEVRKKIRAKCEEAAARKDNPIYYNHLNHYKRLNKIVDKAWKKVEPLRQIHNVEISQEVLDWFLNLEEEFTITDEEQQRLKTRRPKVSIKNNHPVNWKRTKYLFTLYIWTRIQANYLDRPNIIYLNHINKRFKEDADLTTAFSLQQERNLLFDLGLIGVNYALGITPKFIEDYEVFKIPITDENRVVIETGEPGVGDLYRCGYWLQKQKMGSFVCEECGKEFAHYTTSPREQGRKYCKECANKIGHGINNIDTKEIACMDCGAIIEISKFDTKTCRCPECQSEHIKLYDRLRKQNSLENIIKI